VIDYGLLVSMIIGFGVPSLLLDFWPFATYEEPVSFVDVALGPTFAGLAVGRLSALAFDDPSSIGSISDMLIIRSGVEFWPGAAAALAVVLWGGRRGGVSPLARAADLMPLAMIAYGGYEAACVFRDGCFGPDSPLGLKPPGLGTTMLPIGWLMAVSVFAGALAVRSVQRRASPAVTVGVAAVIVATVRAVGSIWLPHIGDGLTRQHLTSIGVGVLVAVALGGLAVGRRRSQSANREGARSV